MTTWASSTNEVGGSEFYGAATRQMMFRRRYGMPFASAPKDRAAGTGRGCRAVVAARLRAGATSGAVGRALRGGSQRAQQLLIVLSVMSSLIALDAASAEASETAPARKLGVRVPEPSPCAP